MNADDQIQLPQLPCFPCPYNASCCAFGTSLSDEEAEAVELNHGAGFVYQTRWGEWRTRVRNRRCALFQNGGCAIHDKPYYPTTCRGFPWKDAELIGRYEYDVTICGEFEVQPELVTLQRSLPVAGTAE